MLTVCGVLWRKYVPCAMHRLSNISKLAPFFAILLLLWAAFHRGGLVLVNTEQDDSGRTHCSSSADLAMADHMVDGPPNAKRQKLDSFQGPSDSGKSSGLSEISYYHRHAIHPSARPFPLFCFCWRRHRATCMTPSKQTLPARSTVPWFFFGAFLDFSLLFCGSPRVLCDQTNVRWPACRLLSILT